MVQSCVASIGPSWPHGDERTDAMPEQAVNPPAPDQLIEPSFRLGTMQQCSMHFPFEGYTILRGGTYNPSHGCRCKAKQGKHIDSDFPAYRLFPPRSWRTRVLVGNKMMQQG
jgi:hypothetical protein